MILYLSDVPALVKAESITAEPVGNSHYQLVVHVNAHQELFLDPTMTRDEAKAILRHIAFRLGGHSIVEISVPELLERLRC